MKRALLRPLVIGSLGAVLNLCACRSQENAAHMPDCSVYGDPGGMKALRCRGWQLFAQMTGSRPVFDSDLWTPERQVFSRTKAAGEGKGIDVFMVPEIPADFYKQGRARLTKFDGKEIRKQPLTYESVFFNLAAVEHIRSHQLNAKETTARLLSESRTEIPEFPKDAMAVKTFWRVLPDNDPAQVGVWGWTNLPQDPNELYEIADPPDGFTNGSVCVEEKPRPNSRCLEAGKYFYISRVGRHPEDFDCQARFGTRCPGQSLPEGTKLILLGMHIASKEKPDWFWATFWWKGDIDVPGQRVPRTHGDSWTCDDAQRPPALKKGLWSNYSMDVTTSLKNPKPVVSHDDLYLHKCGSPPNIGNQEERLAAFNPYVEQLAVNGRKSSCINCHARAYTSEHRVPNPPKPCDAGQPSLETFEGHIRTDYSWSVAFFGLGNTHNDVIDLENPRPEPVQHPPPPCSVPQAAKP